ncbi:MAG: hypothetical protein FJ291_09160 [Planctomycetes bacterium]|nr:hypothetical protein [Planctomycetota bacterium]
MGSLPFIIFWLLLFLCRRELGLGGIVVCIAVWAGLLAACVYSTLPPHVFQTGQVVLDILLILCLFGRDIRIRG